MAEIYGETWVREHGEMPSLMWKVALNKQSQLQVKGAVAEVLKQTITWPPNLPKFIELCNGPQIDTSEAFNRMIKGRSCNGVAEWQTRQEVAWRCKTQLPEDKARKLFSETLNKNIAKVRNGELVEREIIKEKIESPEVHREKETPEQRNVRLDAEIDEKLSKNQRLLGPHKKRFNERDK